MKGFNQGQSIYCYLFVFVLFWCLYSCVALLFLSDMSDHAFFARQVAGGHQAIPGNFLLYLLIIVFSGFSSVALVTKLSLSFLIAFASTYRVYIYVEGIGSVGNNKNFCVNFLIAMSLLFVFALYNPLADCQYFGKFVPNVWHNSTTIFLFPFSLLLFNLSIKQISDYQSTRLVFLSLLVFLNIAIKPSFFFVWASVYPFFLLIQYKFSKIFWVNLLPIIVGLVLLIGQYLYIYKFTSSDSGITIDPFSVYTYGNPFSNVAAFKSSILAMILSFFFPFMFFVLNIRKVLKNKALLFSYGCLFVSILIYILLAETVPRNIHGNFYWQVVICVGILFYQTLLSLLEDIRSNKKQKLYKSRILFIFYLLHVVSGVAYLIKYFVTSDYC